MCPTAPASEECVALGARVARQMTGARAAIVFGSHARGTAVEGRSDVDLLVLVDDRIRAGSPRHVVQELPGKHEVSVLVHDRTSLAELCKSDWSFVEHLRRENLPAFGAVEEFDELLRPWVPRAATVRRQIGAHREVTRRLDDVEVLGGEHLVAYGRLYGAFKSAAILDGFLGAEGSFDRRVATAALARRHPELADDCRELAALEPFWLRLRRRARVELPWRARHDESRLRHHVQAADRLLRSLSRTS